MDEIVSESNVDCVANSGASTSSDDSISSNCEEVQEAAVKVKALLGPFDTQAGLVIEQVDDDHYLFKQGSTKVRVKTYAASDASDVIGDDESKKSFLQGLKLLSLLEALTIFVITLVIKLCTAITKVFPKSVEYEYFLTLYSMSFVYTTYYNFRGKFFRANQIKFSKSHKSSNRWLKGVVVLFAFAIVLKDGLEFFATIFIDLKGCAESRIFIATSIIHISFILSQLKFVFRFSKVYFRNCSIGASTGLMLIIAVNLSSWIASVIDEAVVSLTHGAGGNHSSASAHNTGTNDPTQSTHVYSNASTPPPTTTNAFIKDPDCECHTSFCNAVHVAEKFLFPFLIEFSLVASCLLVVTWNNIGKQPPLCESVIKPSYKFYRSYRGVYFGCYVLFVMIVIVIFLGTAESETTTAPSYYTETTSLITYNSFLIGLETCMLIACCIGFYLFYRIVRPSESSSLLDSVLLLICIIGPLAVDISSMVAIISGPNSRIYGWALSVGQPLCDIIQSLVQLIFILFGMNREPVTSNRSKETEAKLRRRISSHVQRRFHANMGDDDESNISTGGYNNKTYLTSRRSSVASIVSELAVGHQPQFHTTQFHTVQSWSESSKPEANSMPKIVITNDENIEETWNGGESSYKVNQVSFPRDHRNNGDLADDNERGLHIDDPQNQTIMRIVSEVKIDCPDRLRLWLRDVIMFLVISNTCLWVFMSLEGTAFEIYPYQSIFFGTSAWTTIVMVCRPLNIFFRMHSAGCLFEMWSFA